MKNKNIHKIIELLKSNGVDLFIQNKRLNIKKRKDNQLSDEILSIIKSNKEELITFLKSQKNNSTYSIKTASDYGLPIAINNKRLNDFLNSSMHQGSITNISLLTPLQKGFLFHNLYDNNSSAYVCQLHYDVKGELSTDLLEKCWKFLMQKHNVLRTAVFARALEIPVQCVFDQVSLPLTKIDYSTLSNEESESAFDAFLRADKELGFSLEEAPLYRITLIKLGKDLTRLVFTNHHIMLDGWSVQVLMNSLKDCYLRLKSGLSLPVLELDDYKLHVQDISSKNTEEGLLYWKKYLSQLKSPSYLPFIKDVNNRNKVFSNKTKEFRIFENIQDFTKKHHITDNTLVQGVWALLLSKYTRNRTVVFGATISGRNSEKENIEENVGLYINAIPVCSTVNKDQSVVSWLKDLQEEQSIGREEYGYIELSDVEAQSTVKKSLFDTFITFINYPEEAPSEDVKEKLVLENLKAIEGTNYTISLVAISYPDKLDVLIRYNDTVISEQEVLNIKSHIEELIKSILSGTEYIKDLNYLSKVEKNQLLNTFNNTKKDYPKDKSIIDIFSKEVGLHPKRTAVVYNNEELTYEELDKRSNQVAHYLLSKGVIPGNIVGLLFDRSIEMIIGILGVLKTGAGYLPLDSNLPEKRIRYMLNESRAAFLLSKQEYLENYLAYLPVQDINSPEILSQNFKNVAVNTLTTDLAYCIFTSGSTGNPKGVIMNQSSVVNLVKGLEERVYKPYRDSILRVSLLASYAFDASVQQIFGALLQGHSLYVADDETRKDGNKLLSFYNDNKIDVSDGTPTHLRFLVDSIKEGATLNSLSSWILAGEVLPKDLVSTFYSKLGEETQLYNFYGPTETCVDSTSFKIDSKKLKYLKTIPIGKPLPNERVYVTDNCGNLVPIGVVGELCIAGDGLAQRYIGDPLLTSEKFSSEWMVGEDRVYRTGDMVKWLPDGNLEFHGRKDDQVKIRGYRIELAEIEEQLNMHSKIERAVVVSKEFEKEICLIAYYKGIDKLDVSEIREHLSTILPEYMIPYYYMYVDDFTYMNNGKIDRKSLPDLELSKTNDYEEPINEIEEKLIELYSEILMLDTNIIGGNSSFIDLGGHSLKMVFLANSITKHFGVKISLKQIMTNPTIKELGKLISKSNTINYTQIPVAKPRDYYPLSSSQKRMYFMYEYDKESITYNIPMIATLDGVLNKERLEVSFKKLINRHDSLRTVFEFVKEDLVQRILPEVDFSINHIYNGTDLDSTIRNFIKPFNLSLAPLLRVGLIEISSTQHIILMDCHHIISDEVTSNILLKDLASLYNEENLPEPRIQYKDFVVWQNEEKQQKEIANDKEYWLKKFSNEIPVLELPYDYPRTKKLNTEGGTYTFELDKNQVKSLKTIVQSEGLTMYTMFLAIYNILLCKLSGQNDIVIGTPVVGRPDIDLQDVAGIFINTLPLRNNVDGELTFKKFIKQVQKRNIMDLDHQLYPYEDLLDSLDIERDADRNALFDVFFNYYSENDRFTSINSDIKIQIIEDSNPQAKFDLILTLFESKEKLTLNFTFKNELFKQDRIVHFGAYINSIINQILNDYNILVKDIDILSSDEVEQQLIEFNNTSTDYQRNKTIIDLFSSQVTTNPDKVALVFEDKELTYRELDKRSNQLARYINQKNNIKSSLIGVCVDRSFDMIISVLAVLKTGRGYVPIDATYPPNRINNIVEDSGISLIITEEINVPLFTELDHIILDKERKLLDEQSYIKLSYKMTADDLAYAIYTSGSTGKPKGVMVNHRNVVKLAQEKGPISISSSDRVLQWSNVAFDGSVYDIFCSLLNGATLHLINKKIVSDVLSLSQLIEKHEITVAFITTALFNVFVNSEITGLLPLRKLLFGGERASLKNVKRAYDMLGPDVMIHCYGPTETTVYATYYPINKRPENNVPIGRGLSNTKVYVLNPFHKLCSIGVVGELYIGGDGVALGYLNDGMETKDKFIDNPYDTGTYLYKTGDLVKWLPDGNLEFIGRKDNQIKLRGYRIELKEIETVLESHSLVEQAFVIVQGLNENKKLYAYLKGNGESQTKLIIDTISDLLPNYMIPTNFIWVENFPYTTNGKIDHKRLLKKEIKSELLYVAPSNEIEEKLVKLWSKILDLQENKVSVEASFMSLGGHSLNVMYMVNAIKKDFGIQIKLYDVFKGKTIRQLSEVIAMEAWFETENHLEGTREEILL